MFVIAAILNPNEHPSVDDNALQSYIRVHESFVHNRHACTITDNSTASVVSLMWMLELFAKVPNPKTKLYHSGPHAANPFLVATRINFDFILAKSNVISQNQYETLYNTLLLLPCSTSLRKPSSVKITQQQRVLWLVLEIEKKVFASYFESINFLFLHSNNEKITAI